GLLSPLEGPAPVHAEGTCHVSGRNLGSLAQPLDPPSTRAHGARAVAPLGRRKAPHSRVRPGGRPATQMPKSVGSYIFNAVRGGAVGATEALPGISGGTVALIVGLYDKLIGGAGHAVSGIKRYVTDVPRGRGKA